MKLEYKYKKLIDEVEIHHFILENYDEYKDHLLQFINMLDVGKIQRYKLEYYLLNSIIEDLIKKEDIPIKAKEVIVVDVTINDKTIRYSVTKDDKLNIWVVTI